MRSNLSSVCRRLSKLDASSYYVLLSRRSKITGSFKLDEVKRHYEENYTHKHPEFNGTSSQKFTIVLPPPNVTGVLHVGHALTVAIEDAFCRFRRLCGDEVKWIPGFDHAGIATQQVVEKRLMRERGKRIDEISPEEFLAYCTQWKDQRISDISTQLKQLFVSLDWHDYVFYTMDKKFTKAVRTAFIELHRKGLIYRHENQWYLNCDNANKAILHSLKNGEFDIDPVCTESKLLEWIVNNEPWCLSRQQLWGHKIPMFRQKGTENWVAAESIEEASKLLNLPLDAIEQDLDVMDTWFSSALIPLIVVGNWPENKSLKFPLLDVMQTGHDIIGFWIARMMTMSYNLTGQFPFTRCSMHGLIRDEQGRKMSKSLGNVIDPLHLINGVTLKEMTETLRNSNLPAEEVDAAIKTTRKIYPQGIKRYGADALRFAFFKHDLLGLDINMNLILTAGEGLRFCNKMWNMVKYVDILMEKAKETQSSVTGYERSDAEDVIIKKLNDTLETFNEQMLDLRPHIAFTTIFDFILRDFCDVYLETTKQAVWNAEPNRLAAISEVITYTASVSLKCMSIFMPVVCNYLLDQSPNLFNLQQIHQFSNFAQIEQQSATSDPQIQRNACACAQRKTLNDDVEDTRQEKVAVDAR